MHLVKFLPSGSFLSVRTVPTGKTLLIKGNVVFCFDNGRKINEKGINFYKGTIIVRRCFNRRLLAEKVPYKEQRKKGTLGGRDNNDPTAEETTRE